MNNPMGVEAIEVARVSGNVNTQGTMAVEILDLSETSKEAQLQHAETLRRFEAQTRARSVIVPTDIEEVKLKLRSMDQPITLFGEGPAERRERLKQLIASFELSSDEAARMQQIMFQQAMGAGTEEEALEQEQKKKETFYTHASEELIQLRIDLAKDSFENAQKRLQQTKEIRENEASQTKEDSNVALLYKDSKTISLTASQYADERPLTSVRMCANASKFATSSLSPVVKVWDSDTITPSTSLTGHIERVTSLAWHPAAYKEEGAALLASTSADSTCMLWDTRNGDRLNGDEMEIVASGSRSEEEAVRLAAAASAAANAATSRSSALLKLQGHEGVVSKCEFHPNGRYLGTTGHDFTWRLWDIETGKEMLLQDGHIKECSAIAFQPDGALAFTADWAGVGILWDLRSGQV